MNSRMISRLSQNSISMFKKKIRIEISKFQIVNCSRLTCSWKQLVGKIKNFENCLLESLKLENFWLCWKVPIEAGQLHVSLATLSLEILKLKSFIPS